MEEVIYFSHEVGGWFYDFWFFEFTKIGPNPITVGKVFTALVLFIVGYYLCRRMSNQISKRFLSKLDIDASLNHALETFIFYSSIIVLALFILRLLDVPVTIFTVLGGALAIGVGFGSQNVVNNFISGLIMMIERPVRVGDFVEIDKLNGVVEHIGARSTKIKSMENRHVVVPNSFFLEKYVLNWTLSDDLIRSKISVGVAYGSDVKEVEAALLESLSTEERVLKYPKGTVIFRNFGASSLEFDLYFWTRLRDFFQLLSLQSRIRFAVDEIFKAKDIVISFPQRDIHMDMPLQVELTKAPNFNSPPSMTL